MPAFFWSCNQCCGHPLWLINIGVRSAETAQSWFCKWIENGASYSYVVQIRQLRFLTLQYFFAHSITEICWCVRMVMPAEDWVLSNGRPQIGVVFAFVPSKPVSAGDSFSCSYIYTAVWYGVELYMTQDALTKYKVLQMKICACYRYHSVFGTFKGSPSDLIFFHRWWWIVFYSFTVNSLLGKMP